MASIKKMYAIGPGFISQLDPFNNTIDKRSKQFMFNEMMTDPTALWTGEEIVELREKSLEFCGSKSTDFEIRATRDFHQYMLQEGWIVERVEA
jgi:hypothetical protein